MSKVTHSPEVTENMHDSQIFRKYLGQHEYYNDYLRLFTREVVTKGVEWTLTEYLFKGDERADDLLARMFDGEIFPSLFVLTTDAIGINIDKIVQASCTLSSISDTASSSTSRSLSSRHLLRPL
jgi:hypothetical protein